MKRLHDYNNHKLVMESLIAVAKETGTNFFEVKRDFIAGNKDLTILFWKHFYSVNPYKTKGVEYCHACRNFIFEFQKPLMTWSFEYDLIQDQQICNGKQA